MHFISHSEGKGGGGHERGAEASISKGYAQGLEFCAYHMFHQPDSAMLLRRTPTDSCMLPGLCVFVRGHQEHVLTALNLYAVQPAHLWGQS
jgi:hypothetical protein